MWTESFDRMGIYDFTASTLTPVQGQSLDLSATLYNDERISCQIHKLEFFLGDTLIHSTDAAGSLSPGDRFSYTFPYTHDGLGTADIRLAVTGSANGQPRVWNKTLTLQYRPGQIVTGLLVDGSHGSIPAIQNLTTLAGHANLDVTIFEEFPEGGQVLLLFTPDREYEEAFLARVRVFAENGGSIILCGRSDAGDGDIHAAAQLNRVLEALGATVRFHDNTALDPVNHGDTPDQLFPTAANQDFPWCAGLTSAQYYAHLSGCTVDPGQGTWLVQGFDTTRPEDSDGDGKTGRGRVLLAVEDTPWGGRILSSGAEFLSDRSMPLPKNQWAAPGLTRVFWSIFWKLKRQSFL